MNEDLISFIILIPIFILYFYIRKKVKEIPSTFTCSHCKKEYDNPITLEAFDLYYKESCPHCYKELPIYLP